MIKGFDQQTQPLSEYEENTLLPVILQGLYKIDEARCRKLINHIRTTDILPGLIATSGGYFLAESETELLDYEESLLGRENAIKEVRLAIARQRHILFDDAHKPQEGSIF